MRLLLWSSGRVEKLLFDYSQVFVYLEEDSLDGTAGWGEEEYLLGVTAVALIEKESFGSTLGTLML